MEWIYSKNTDEYTPSIDTWVIKTDTTIARYQLATSTINNKGYIYGGLNGSTYYQNCDEYDPDTWTNKNDMPLPAKGLMAASSIKS